MTTPLLMGFHEWNNRKFMIPTLLSLLWGAVSTLIIINKSMISRLSI